MVYFYRIKQMKLEKILEEKLRCCDEIKTYKYQQKSVLGKIKSETKLKINDLRRILKAPAEEYLNTINKLQNQISQMEAYSCFENDQLKHVNTITRIIVWNKFSICIVYNSRFIFIIRCLRSCKNQSTH